MGVALGEAGDGAGGDAFIEEIYRATVRRHDGRPEPTQQRTGRGASLRTWDDDRVAFTAADGEASQALGACRNQLTGTPVTEATYAGRPMAIFFGYANCEAICSVALPAMAAALDLLGDEADGIAPVLITVDPERDTPEAMALRLPDYHPRLIGLTGSEEALARARGVFQVEATQVTETPEGDPIYAHGSFIYLVGPDGEVKTVMPPILSPERMAALMRKYFGQTTAG